MSCNVHESEGGSTTRTPRMEAPKEEGRRRPKRRESGIRGGRGGKRARGDVDDDDEREAGVLVADAKREEEARHRGGAAEGLKRGRRGMLFAMGPQTGREKYARFEYSLTVIGEK